MNRFIYFLMIGSLISCSEPKKSTQEESNEEAKYATTGTVSRIDPAINFLIPEGAEIEILASGFEWTEGPLWLADQKALIFSDVPTNKIWKWTEADSVILYLEPSGYLGDVEGKKEPGSNGLVLSNAGRLLLCQHGERRIAEMNAPLDQPKPDYIPIVYSYNNKKFNSPNDLVINSSNQLFFTDPPYGLDDWDTKELDFQGVYRLDSAGALHVLIDSLSRPNGIGLSPDERTLYVAQSDPKKARYYAFDLDEQGNVVSGKVLLDATPAVGNENPGLPDGMTVDEKGNLFASGPGGIWVISSEGKHLGVIQTGQGTSNCTIDTDGNYLYMTADAYLMRLKLID